MRQEQIDYERRRPATVLGRPARLAIAVGPLFVAASLPVWTVWHIGAREANGYAGTLWAALSVIPRGVRMVGPGEFAASYGAGNALTACLLLVLGVGLERFAVRRAHRPAA